MPIGASSFRPLALAAALALAACSSAGGNDLAALDGEEVDPALTSALEDQILVDPDLVEQAHPNTVRPPEMPVQAQYPPDANLADAEEAPCGPFEHGPQWAGRLAAQFPAYPGARQSDAAGNDRGDCSVRIVSFRTGDPYQRVLTFYRGAAARAGFSAQHHVRGADHLLGGVSERTDAAFVLVVTPVEHGSDVSLIVNNGRG